MSNRFSVLMPDIGEGVVEGEVIQWLKQVGDSVAQDEPVVILMTDKATVELPAPKPGKLAKQYYPQGAIATKGRPLYDIELQGEVLEEPAAPAAPPPPVIAETAPTKAASAAPSTEPHARSRAIPAIRKVVRDLDVDINAIKGTGPEGRVTATDITQHLGQAAPKSAVAPPALAEDVLQPLQGIRRLTAQRVAEAKATIPHFTYCDAVDVTTLVQLRTKLQTEAKRRGFSLTYTPFFVRALSQTLRQFPGFNASFDTAAQTLVLHQPHNIGIAMKTDLGLIVPVLKGVEHMTFEELVKAYNGLRQQALDNQLKRSDMQDGTITLSNFGTEGGRWATPVIVAPQVAILATAKIRAEPVVRADQIVIRQMLNCSWSFDHRVIDGDMAAAFSNAFLHRLENPMILLQDT